MKPFINDSEDISPVAWTARQQAANDARVAEIRRNLGLPVEPAPEAVCGKDDERLEAHHNKVSYARPVVSSKGERFMSANNAAAAMRLGNPCRIHESIRTGCRAAGRYWYLAESEAA